MKIFITAHFKEGENKSEIENLCSLVKEAGFDVRGIDATAENINQIKPIANTKLQYNGLGIEEIIDKIIKERLMDGQLSDSPLTQKDIKSVAAAFNRILRRK